MRLRNVYSAAAASILAGFIHCSPWIPRSLALAGGEKLGGLMFRLASRKGNGAAPRRERRTFIDLSLERSLDDLGQAFGSSLTPEEMKAVARASYRTAGRSLIESLRLPKLPPAELLSLIDADSFDPVHRVLDRGKGLIILTPHLGSWELLASYLVHILDRPFSAIVQRQRFDLYNHLCDSIRNEGAGLRVIYQDAGARPILSALRQNLPVGILGDLDLPKLKGAFVQFFGRPAYTPIGPAALARSSGAGIVPVFIRWKTGSGDGGALRHQVHVLPEIELVRSGDKDADILENTQRWTRVIEEIVRQYPEQWIWFHRRWRTQPCTAEAPGPGPAL